jgi:hypothetical protein
MRQFYAEHLTPESLEQAVQELQRHSGKPPLERPVQESGGTTGGRFLEHPFPETLLQAVRELVSQVPWGHPVESMKKVKAPGVPPKADPVAMRDLVGFLG